MPTLSLESRLRAALLGAAIGAELGFSRRTNPERFQVQSPDDLAQVVLAPVDGFTEERGRIDSRALTPFMTLGVQAYLQSGGRATPETFAALLKDDQDIAIGAFAWDGIHTIQEILKEGMHPRISGLGTAPCGLIAAAMPAVGLYHFADPEYAYLDGVELAAVAQPRLGADWAALCASAIAAAFTPEASPESIVTTVLKLAHQHNKDLYYQLNGPAAAAGWMAHDQAAFTAWWLSKAGVNIEGRATNWVGFNPIFFVLPLLRAGITDARQFMALLLTPPPTNWFDGMLGNHAISAIIGGAILGAIAGPEAFPAEWRAWAEPAAQAWYPLLDVITTRLAKERELITITERLAEPADDGLTLLQDKVYGNMLAGAIGNAMGSPVEGQFYWEIDAKYPGGVTTVLDPRRLEGEDDNQMAMHLVETYIARDGLPVMARHFGKTWAEHLNRDHFFSLCMGNAYDLICQGWDPRITGHWSVVTGSTVMCLEPVGVYHLADPGYASIDATAVSYMYQRGLDMVAAANMAATVAEALRPEATVESILQAALDTAPRQMHTFDTRTFDSPHSYLSACLEIADKYDDVLAARAELYEKCLCYHMIDPLELWGFALAMFNIARGDVRQAAIGGTNIGRDSDTISGRAAMLAGTLNGARGVPADWIALFSPATLERIKRNAGRFAEVLLKKQARLQQRQQLAIPCS